MAGLAAHSVVGDIASSSLPSATSLLPHGHQMEITAVRGITSSLCVPRQQARVCWRRGEGGTSRAGREPFFFFVFLGPHPWHMEVPRLGVQSEL